MFGSSPAFKRGRDEDECSPTKRTRTHGDFDLQLQAVMTGQMQPQQPQSASMHNDGTGVDMNMDEDTQNVPMTSLSNPQHPWNSAPHLTSQFAGYSTSSSATSTAPNTPLDELEFDLDPEDEDLYGDNTYARPPPCYPSPSEYAQTFTNSYGVTEVFPTTSAAFDRMEDANAFAEYAMHHGLDKVAAGQPQIVSYDTSMQQFGAGAGHSASAPIYGWDNPRQTFGGVNSHMS